MKIETKFNIGDTLETIGGAEFVVKRILTRFENNELKIHYQDEIRNISEWDIKRKIIPKPIPKYKVGDIVKTNKGFYKIHELVTNGIMNYHHYITYAYFPNLCDMVSLPIGEEDILYKVGVDNENPNHAN